MLRRLGTTLAIVIFSWVLTAGSASGTADQTDHVSVGPTGGNAALDAVLVGYSKDGRRAFFDTDESLVSADQDSSFDVYERFNDVTTLISIGPTGGGGPHNVTFDDVSDTGSSVFFETAEQLTSSDTDSQTDVYQRSSGTTTLVSIGPAGGNGPFGATFRGASRDASRVFVETRESLVTADTDAQLDVYEHASGVTTLISTGSVGGNGAAPSSFAGVSIDGSRVTFDTTESLVAGDTDSGLDVYQSAAGVTTLVSTGPAAGNSGADAFYAGASDDGLRLFFHTDESLVAGDTDSRFDVYERVGDVTSLISIGPAGGNSNGHDALLRDNSSDGSRAFFETSESLVTVDTDSVADVYERTDGTTSLISIGSTNGVGVFPALYRGSSADGARVFFESHEPLVAADTDTSTDVYERASGATALLSIGATGGNGPSPAGFDGASSDGSRVFFHTGEQLYGADTDSFDDVYERAGGVTTLVSRSPTAGNGNFFADFAGASADGTNVLIHTDERLLPSDTDPSLDVYVSRSAGYLQPAGASPMRLSLVMAMQACTSPNRVHGPPALGGGASDGSCSPPVPASSHLTVGTPQANGMAANAVAFVRYDAIVGDPATPADEADVKLSAIFTDVRNQGDLSDYTGELRITAVLRLTDRAVAGSSETITDVPYAFPAICSATPAPGVGGTCSVDTTAEALVPGTVSEAVGEGARSIWQLGQVRVYDGGADGDVDTPAGDTLYQVQGLFVP